jgi:ATP-dependent Clp protease ATP-binding subunit ClpA
MVVVRAVPRMLENPLAVEVLAGRIAEGDHIVVRPDGERFEFVKRAETSAA